MPEFSEIKDTNILIDTNVLINYASAGFKDRSGNPLRILRDNRNSLHTIPLVGFELLRTDSRKDVSDKYLNFLNYIGSIEIERVFCQNAAMLAGDYRRFFGKAQRPTTDMILGGAIIAYELSGQELLLLTTDRNDFREPLWNTVARCIVPRGDDKKSEHIILFLLKIDLAQLSVEEDDN